MHFFPFETLNSSLERFWLNEFFVLSQHSPFECVRSRERAFCFKKYYSFIILSHLALCCCEVKNCGSDRAIFDCTQQVWHELVISELFRVSRLSWLICPIVLGWGSAVWTVFNDNSCHIKLFGDLSSVHEYLHCRRQSSKFSRSDSSHNCLCCSTITHIRSAVNVYRKYLMKLKWKVNDLFLIKKRTKKKPISR